MTTKDRQPLPFQREMLFEYGKLQELTPGLRRLVCQNPGPFTFKGTNTYILGRGDVAVVDPGPLSDEHLDNLQRSLAGERVTHILVTHCHSDHSGAVADLKQRTGAQVCGMPRASDDPALVATSPSGAKFVAPVNFDRNLTTGDQVHGNGWRVEAIHTPGHAPDHLCYAVPDENLLLAGDHVMGWSTTVIAPPEGNLGRYQTSLELISNRSEGIFYPGHGGPITEPQRLIRALLIHRRLREAEILELLRQDISSIDRLVPKIYAEIQSSLAGAAALTVFAQLEWLVERGIVKTTKPGPLSRVQEFAIVER